MLKKKPNEYDFDYGKALASLSASNDLGIPDDRAFSASMDAGGGNTIPSSIQQKVDAPAAYQSKDQAAGVLSGIGGGAGTGAALGSYLGPWGTVIGGAVGAIAGGVGSGINATDSASNDMVATAKNRNDISQANKQNMQIDEENRRTNARSGMENLAKMRSEALANYRLRNLRDIVLR